jgi:hypothetical protein
MEPEQRKQLVILTQEVSSIHQQEIVYSRVSRAKLAAKNEKTVVERMAKARMWLCGMCGVEY